MPFSFKLLPFLRFPLFSLSRLAETSSWSSSGIKKRKRKRALITKGGSAVSFFLSVFAIAPFFSELMKKKNFFFFSPKEKPLTKTLLSLPSKTKPNPPLQSPVPVLVDFWAVWCGPCKLVAPLMGAVEKEMGGKLKVVKVNADPCPNLVEKYKVYGLPTLSLFRPGSDSPVAQREGAIGKKALFEWLATNGIEAGVAT